MDFATRRDDVDICSVATSYVASDFQFGLARSPNEIVCTYISRTSPCHVKKKIARLNDYSSSVFIISHVVEQSNKISNRYIYYS